jgi:hypothetical protein
MPRGRRLQQPGWAPAAWRRVGGAARVRPETGRVRRQHAVRAVESRVDWRNHPHEQLARQEPGEEARQVQPACGRCGRVHVEQRGSYRHWIGRQHRRGTGAAGNREKRHLRVRHHGGSERDVDWRRQPGPDRRRPAQAGPLGRGLRHHIGRRRHRLRHDSAGVRHELGDAPRRRRGGPRAAVLHRGLLPDGHSTAASRVHADWRAPQSHVDQQHDRHDRRGRLSQQSRGLGHHPARERAPVPGQRAADARVGHTPRQRPQHGRGSRAPLRRGERHAAAARDARLVRRARRCQQRDAGRERPQSRGRRARRRRNLPGQ